MDDVWDDESALPPTAIAIIVEHVEARKAVAPP